MFWYHEVTYGDLVGETYNKTDARRKIKILQLTFCSGVFSMHQLQF
jgi:hypothetical protein